MTAKGYRKKPVLGPMDARLVAQVMSFWRGEHESVVGWLCSLGCCLTRQEGAEYTLVGTSGIAGGLIWPAGDPVTVAVQFAFFLAGAYWPHAFPGLLHGVNWEWEQERVARKAREAVSTPRSES